jgi:hypothetical protein
VAARPCARSQTDQLLDAVFIAGIAEIKADEYCCAGIGGGGAFEQAG